ncbi:hypothetical protein OROHE_017164 [Orobanche hederae]
MILPPFTVATFNRISSSILFAFNLIEPFSQQCVDNSGNWGRGGLFDAVARLSPNAYERPSEFGISIWDNGDPSTHPNAPQWVALAVVQSYNPRRKVPRSGISISDLDVCLAKASFTASRHSDR